MSRIKKIVDGNEAAAYVAYAFTEVAGIYPITPSSPMAEKTDEWAAAGVKNIFGQPVRLVEMQSEAGACGAVHGALEAGALATSYTSSQGLLLMIPTMHRISGQRHPGVLHVASRTVGTHAFSIFGDHSDVMNCKHTGFAMLSTGSVQEVMDLAGVAHLAAIKSRIPFLHFFDGFRTSHEIQKVEALTYDEFASLADWEAIENFRNNALNPEEPVMRSTVQNPDIYFQVREASNNDYERLPNIVQGYMNEIAKITGRQYKIFDYYGAKDADQVIVAMGSVSGTAREVVKHLNELGEKVGFLQVHLYRPFSTEHMLAQIPKTCRKLTVIDRLKDAGAVGEPLYEDVCTAYINEEERPEIFAGRYGLSSKDTTPAQIKAIFDNMKADSPKNHFTVGIEDDVTHLSLPLGQELMTEPEGTISCKFWGLGSDGTVGANKNSIKIIGETMDMYCQAYFEYDTKKSFGVTKSHLRFGKSPINSTYLVKNADFIACHNRHYLEKYDIITELKRGGIFLLNCDWTPEEAARRLPGQVKRYIIDNNIKFYIIDANKCSGEIGLGDHSNMVLQAAFFKLAKIIPAEDAAKQMKKAARKTYEKKGEKVVNMNLAAIDAGFEAAVKVELTDYERNFGSFGESADDRYAASESAETGKYEALESAETGKHATAGKTGGDTNAGKTGRDTNAGKTGGDTNAGKINGEAVPEKAGAVIIGARASSCENGESGKAEEYVPKFIKNILEPVNTQKGDDLPVSAMIEMKDGTVPLGTSAYEKRGMATAVPVWNKDACLQCNRCSFVCPHAVIRPFLVSEKEAEAAPYGFEMTEAKGKSFAGLKYSIQVSTLDCTGCGSCAASCPKRGEALRMVPVRDVFAVGTGRDIRQDREKGDDIRQDRKKGDDVRQNREKGDDVCRTQEDRNYVLQDQVNWDYAVSLSEKADHMDIYTVKGSQFRQPLLEFSGACAGCGETPYIKLLTQLYGDKMYIANATGCTQAWGAAMPCFPYCKNKEGKGPAWSNSLFENNAEFSYGMCLAVKQQRESVKANAEALLGISENEAVKTAIRDWLLAYDDLDFSADAAKRLVQVLEGADNTEDLTDLTDIKEKISKENRSEKKRPKETVSEERTQAEKVSEERLQAEKVSEERTLTDNILKKKKHLSKKTMWMVGGDGWAYDIGYGGLDHVFAMNEDVNVLVVDTEVYSNTGGQSSKATPVGAVAQFQSAGKRTRKKDLGLLMMSYDNVYVAQCSMGADPGQLMKAMKEAQEHKGPSLIIAYAPCINHGIKKGMENAQLEMKRAVESGYWNLYRYIPETKNFILDSGKPSMALIDFLRGEVRYSALEITFPENAEKLFAEAEAAAGEKYESYRIRSEAAAGEKYESYRIRSEAARS